MKYAFWQGLEDFEMFRVEMQLIGLDFQEQHHGVVEAVPERGRHMTFC